MLNASARLSVILFHFQERHLVWDLETLPGGLHPQVEARCYLLK